MAARYYGVGASCLHDKGQKPICIHRSGDRCVLDYVVAFCPDSQGSLVSKVPCKVSALSDFSAVLPIVSREVPPASRAGGKPGVRCARVSSACVSVSARLCSGNLTGIDWVCLHIWALCHAQALVTVVI